MEAKQKYGQVNQLNLHLIIGLYRSYAKLNRNTQRLLSQHNLTLAQFGVLEVLYHLGPMKIGDVIDKTLSTSGNMTVVIKNLEKENWIRRAVDPADGRVSVIQLTTQGEQLIATVFPQHLNQLNKMMENLNQAEKKQMIQLMKKLNGV
jgi:DNA-binding MarR family transcriptional regulator